MPNPSLAKPLCKSSCKLLPFCKPPTAILLPGWAQSTTIFSPWTLGSTRLRGTQETGMFGIKSSIWLTSSPQKTNNQHRLLYCFFILFINLKLNGFLVFVLLFINSCLVPCWCGRLRSLVITSLTAYWPHIYLRSGSGAQTNSAFHPSGR